MELLYFVDRTITRAIQALSKFISTHHRLSASQQGKILVVLGFLVYLGIWVVTPDVPHSNIWLILLYIGIFAIVWPVLVVASTIGLLTLHRLIDPDGLIADDKQYSNGHMAWARVVILLIFAVSWKLTADINLAYLLSSQTIVFIPESIFHAFLARRPSDRHRRREQSTMTEAMQSLLDRCSSWLPVPKPSSA